MLRLSKCERRAAPDRHSVTPKRQSQSNVHISQPSQCRIGFHMPKRRKNPDSVREESVNTLLAQALRGRGISAKAERRGSKGVPDISVHLRSGDTIILECKWGDRAAGLESQLEQRLKDFPEVLGVIGVHYQEGIRYLDDINQALEVTNIQWWLHGSRGVAFPVPQPLRNGDVADLADHLRIIPLELEGRDRVAAAADAIGSALEKTAQQISTHARNSRLIADVIARSDQENDKAAALRIGCLVLFNALAFQDRLASASDDVPSITESLANDLEGLRDTWLSICKNIDYVPVFELAAEIVKFLTYWPARKKAWLISHLVKAVDDTHLLEGHDLSGRLFHTLLTDAKFTGAYYTSVSAATLLSRLVFHNWPPRIDWADHEFPASLNVADLACGTGTLLMAVAEEAQRRHADAGGTHAAELHKAMVEQALHGYDVQLSAVHFAATTLAMLRPDIRFDRMNLWVMPLGAEGSKVSLGSLDFLGESEAAVQFALSPQETGIGVNNSEKVTGNGPVVETAKLPELDLAIMNPPFTRSVGGNMLFGNLPQAERAKLQKELSRRLKSRQASATAGLGAAFVAAASPRLRLGEGRLALVLPATVCTGPSWQQTRSLIEKDFALDMVIASHDPTRWNFSESTDLSECLLIATRRPAENDHKERRTTFVNLWWNPAGVLDAHRIAHSVTATPPAQLEETGTALLEVDGLHVGEVLSMPETKLKGKKWSGIQFARADLIRSASRLLDGGEVSVPGESETADLSLCSLGDLGQIGPDRRRLVDGFDKTTVKTAYPLVEGHDTEHRKSMTCSPNSYLAPLPKPRGGQKPGYGKHLWQMAGRLLVAESLRLDTARIVAMRSKTKVLSNVWWPIRLESPEVERALSIWLNSSLGLLAILAERTSTEGAWVAMKKADLETLPVLDPRRLSPSQLQALSDLFDELSEAEFERLPNMARCPTRRALDDGLSRILNLPDLSKLRDLLASEPVVSNRPL